MTESSSGFSLATLLPFLSLALGSKRNNNFSNGILGNRSSQNSHGMTMNRAFGTAATFGLTVAILKFVVDSQKALANHHDADSENTKTKDKNHEKAIHQLLNRSDVLFQFVKTFLRAMLLKDYSSWGKTLVEQGSSQEEEEEETEDEEEENGPMIHKGSCHCRSVSFELVAPRKIMYKSGLPGKIQFKHARVRARSFRFIRGEHFVKMYYVQKPSKKKSPRSSSRNNSNHNGDVGAHSFCSRCGTNILYAPNSYSTALDVNLDCLNQETAKLKLSSGKESNLSRGFAVADQWDHDQENNSRHPTTIAEEGNSMAFFPAVDQRSLFSGLQNHHPRLQNDRNNNLDPDASFLYDGDGDTIYSESYMHNGGRQGKPEPDTPSSIYTLQTESYTSSSASSNVGGVPPTLTLDTRDCYNDAESVVSLSSTRSNFHQKYNPPPQQQNHHSSSASISLTTAPMMRHQMKYYMQKHMMSSSSSVSSSHSRASLISPSSTRNNKESAAQNIPKEVISRS